MITINGNAIQLTAPCTVETLLVEQGYSLQRIAVERNGDILSKTVTLTPSFRMEIPMRLSAL